MDMHLVLWLRLLLVSVYFGQGIVECSWRRVWSRLLVTIHENNMVHQQQRIWHDSIFIIAKLEISEPPQLHSIRIVQDKF
jgi:hypothetical protein